MAKLYSLAVFKALAHDSRLRIIQGLLSEPRCVEELAERLALSPSTVSFHLDKLEEAGLVTSSREQYYRIYSIRPGGFSMTVRDLIRGADGDPDLEEKRLRRHRRRVRAAFFQGGRLVRMPAQRRKRRVVLEEFARSFEPGIEYTETEVNRTIHGLYEDHCLIRRLLVEEGFMTRERQIYKKSPVPAGRNAFHAYPRPSREADEGRGPGPGEKARRRAIKAAYKLQPRTAGVFQVKNRKNGRVLLGSSLNMHGPFNRIRMELETGIMRNPDLLSDWRRHGADAFSFDILETLPEEPDSDISLEERLREREEAWIERLRPFGEKGYNRDGRVRIA